VPEVDHQLAALRRLRAAFGPVEVVSHDPAGRRPSSWMKSDGEMVNLDRTTRKECAKLLVTLGSVERR
jgi:hypothetical protein